MRLSHPNPICVSRLHFIGRNVLDGSDGGRGLPGVARLLTLAHHFQGLIGDAHVRTYTELAMVGHVSRARLSQIMDLLLLAQKFRRNSCSCRRLPRGGIRWTSGD